MSGDGIVGGAYLIENLLGLVEVDATNLHPDATDGAVEMPGLPRHDLVGNEALDSFGLQATAQKLRRRQFAEARERNQVVRPFGISHAGEGSTIAALSAQDGLDRCQLFR